MENFTIDDLLYEIVKRGASDLHLGTNEHPRCRVDGDLKIMANWGITTEKWFDKELQRIGTRTGLDTFQNTKELDFAYGIDGLSRFRVNAFVQRQKISMVLRTIPNRIKSLEEIGAPVFLNELVKLKKGLILVTGPTGSGKSTTLTAMIDAINETRREHIVTIEDPIEFVHENKKSLISQREVGSDTQSFQEALKRVLRQDPDVILIGELRDYETIATALTAAETGHLVFGTLHTQSSSKTINRIIDTFPSEQQNQIRTQLSDTLQAVISQTLVKRIGGGRVMATEILTRTNSVASMIREGKVTQLVSELQTGSIHGMHTLDSDLQRLVAEGIVNTEDVIDLITDKNIVKNIYSIQSYNN